MDTGLVLGIAAAVTLLVGLCLLVPLLAVRRRNRRLSDELIALRGRLDRLEAANATAGAADRPAGRHRRTDSEFVITTAGLPELRDGTTEGAPRAQVDARRFASLAAGESLVRIVSVAHGVRRALSAQNRNRIGFEVKREIRRARRQRKRDLKDARRHLRASERGEDAA